MNQKPFDVARAAFSSLELFSDHYASSEAYQAQHRQILAMLRDRAMNIRTASPHEANFYEALAAALEKLNGQ
mgnify:CR=1 FL=1